MFSLKSLLLVVAIAGLGTAGLIHRTQLWGSAFIGITLCLLLGGVFRAWLVPRTRAFWGPFAATGATYFCIVSLQSLAELHYNLPTTQLVVCGLEKLQSPTPPPAIPNYSYAQPIPSPGSPGAYASPLSSYVVVTPVASASLNRSALFGIATTRSSGDGFAAEARAFFWVAQCLWCLLLAAVAGVTCSWLVRRSETSRKLVSDADAG